MDEERLPQKDFKFDTDWKKEKRETGNKMERRSTQINGRMRSASWRLGEQTS
jgi:hypothetical protein